MVVVFLLPLYSDGKSQSLGSLRWYNFIYIGYIDHGPSANFYLALLLLNIIVAFVVLGLSGLSGDEGVRMNIVIYFYRKINELPLWGFVVFSLLSSMVMLMAVESIGFVRNWVVTNTTEVLIGYSPVLTCYFGQKLKSNKLKK